jgi:15-cis-phytoene synthase
LVSQKVMNAEFYNLSAPKRLALAYARPDLRDFLGLVLRMDDRLASLVQTNREVIIGQMRFAWWNDAIAKSKSARRQGEPLLALLGAIENAGQGEVARASCLQLLEAWEMLLIDEDRQIGTLTTHAKLRGEAIFGGYAILAGVTEKEAVCVLGAQWATQMDDMPKPRLPKSLRPLSILARAAQLEQSGKGRAGLVMTWHALTGR